MATKEELFDWRQLKSDQTDHAFTSEASLRTFARYLRMGGTPITRDEVNDLLDWLQQHSSELPGELYDRDGLPRFAKAELPSSWGTVNNQDQHSTQNDNGFNDMGEMRHANSSTADSVLQDTTGMYYTAELACNRSIGSVFGELVKSVKDPEQRASLRALGPTVPAVRNLIRLKRGALYAQHVERQAKRLRWQGMEEYDAVAKADVHLKAGTKLEAATSNAAPLPPLERVSELLSYDSEQGVLVRRVKAGRSAAGDTVRISKVGQVRIDGTLVLASRLAVLLHTGSDPANKTVTVKNGNKQDIRWCNLEVESYTMKETTGSVRRRRADGDDKYDSVVKLNGKAITIGTYRSAMQAVAARRVFRRALELG